MMTAKYVLECWSSGASPSGRTVTLTADNYTDAEVKAKKLLYPLNYGYYWKFRVVSIEEQPEEPGLSETVLDELRAGIASLNAGQGIPAKRRIRKTGV
jgi:hypothetical protein